MKSASTTKLVAIIGGSGAGKTWLTQELLKRLGGVAASISMDHFYRDRSHLSAARRSRINFDHPRAINWPHFEKVLRACKAGQALSLPVYDFHTHTRSPGKSSFQPKPIVLVEGLWPILRRSTRSLFDFSIYLECPARLRLNRRLARDVVHRGRSRSAIRLQFQQMVAPMHDRFVAPQKGRATLALEKPITESEVQRLSEQLINLLRPTRTWAETLYFPEAGRMATASKVLRI